MTRTGKTTAARELIRKYLMVYPGLRVHIFDPKDVGDYNNLTHNMAVKTLHVRGSRAPDALRTGGVLIWHPKRATWDEYARWFETLADDPEPSLTVVDETRRLVRRMGDTNSFPLPFVTILQEGAGQLHGMVILLQEIAGSAREIMGQSTHLMRFRLANAYDERSADSRIARARRSGRIRNPEPQHWHGFFHSRIDNLDAAREFTSWREFL